MLAGWEFAMSSSRVTIVGLIVLLFLMPFRAAADKETITWLKIDFPPIYITDGPHVGEGVADRIIDLFIDRLSDYEHIVRVANLSRIHTDLKLGTNVCTPTMFVTAERKEFGIYSKNPTTFLPPLQLIIRAEDAAKFTRGGADLSLDDLLDAPDLILGVAAGVSYGKKVDRVISGRQGAANLFIRQSGGDVLNGLMEMVLKKRIDYTISYPWAVSYSATPEDVNRLTFIPFSEAGRHPRHYVLCANNAWGRKTIARLDAVLTKALPTPEYRALIERWLPPKERAAYRMTYDDHFKVK